MAMRTTMNYGGLIVTFDRTGAKEELRRQMLKIQAAQEKKLSELKKEQHELEDEYSKLEKKLENQEKELSDLAKESIELDKEDELATSLIKRQKQFGVYIKKINELATQFNQQVLKRGKLTSVLVANAIACTELKGEKFIQQLAITQSNYDDVTKEVK